MIKQLYSIEYKVTSSTVTFYPLDFFLLVSFGLGVLPPSPLSSIKSAHRSQCRIILFNTARKTRVTADALLINFNLELFFQVHSHTSACKHTEKGGEKNTLSHTFLCGQTVLVRLFSLSVKRDPRPPCFCRTASPGRSDSSSSRTGRSKACPNPGRDSSISLARCIKPRSSLDRTGPSPSTAGKLLRRLRQRS